MRDQIPRAQAPSRLAMLLELRAPLDWASLVYRAPQLAAAPKGDGRPVMLIPGYGTDESSMRPLGHYLKYLGYEVYDWAQGRNRGDVENDVRRVGRRAQEIHDTRDNAPVTLIGWSLGGVTAREAARLFERYVREVITLGTPIIGGPKYTSVAGRFAKSANLNLDDFEKKCMNATRLASSSRSRQYSARPMVLSIGAPASIRTTSRPETSRSTAHTLDWVRTVRSGT